MRGAVMRRVKSHCKSSSCAVRSEFRRLASASSALVCSSCFRRPLFSRVSSSTRRSTFSMSRIVYVACNSFSCMYALLGIEYPGAAVAPGACPSNCGHQHLPDVGHIFVTEHNRVECLCRRGCAFLATYQAERACLIPPLEFFQL